MEEHAEEFAIVALPALRIAGHRMRVPYNQCGPGFAKVCRHAGRHCAGKPLTLYHAPEDADGIADLETCVPVGPAVCAGEGISVRELPACRALTYRHHGPWDRLGASWAKVMAHLEAQGLVAAPPFREVYVKGPGMFFKGNPEKYVTEIQVPLQEG